MQKNQQWKRITPGAPIIKNLQIIVKSLKCLVEESLKRDVENIKAMAEHLKDRPEIEKQLIRRKQPDDLAGV